MSEKAEQEQPLIMTQGGQARTRYHGIFVEVIVCRFVGGETVAELADDYGLTRAYIEAALRWKLVAEWDFECEDEGEVR